MKHYNLPLPSQLIIGCWLFASMLFTISCQKEKALEASHLEKNYFVINDNPNDPVDHAIYEFYKSVGIACFYSDSIYKKKVSKEEEDPARYAYVKLSLNYTPLGSKTVSHQPLSSRNHIPALLELMKQEVVPKLPSPQMIPSVMFIDSFWLPLAITNMQIAHGWTSLYGFNTVGIKVKDVTLMNNEERKTYAASILAGIAEKRINDNYTGQLQKDFFSISRALTKSLISVDIYVGLPLMYMLPPASTPLSKTIGFLFYPTIVTFPAGQLLVNSPRESDDFRAFMTAAFNFTTEEFSNLYANDAHVLKKFGIIKKIAKEAGFKLPD